MRVKLRYVICCFMGWFIPALVLLITVSGCQEAVEQANRLSSDIPFRQNERLRRTMNFGNALEAPHEGDWGVTLRAEYFRIAAEKGFTAVRIPIRWNAHAGEESPYTIDGAFFKRVDWAIAHALAQGLAVVINIHHYEDLMAAPSSNRARFLSLWKQIAEHYEAYPTELIFEILNEPNAQLTPELWNTYLAQAIPIIRNSNPSRTLIVGPGNWNNLEALPTLSIPNDEENVIVTFHYYSPFHFTHQGASWAGAQSRAWLGTTWDGTIQEKQSIQSDLERAMIWGQQHHRPIFLGEFGAYSAGDMASRARWTNYIAREAETLGISWGYWEFCAGFGVYDPVKREWQLPLLEALIPETS